MQRPLTREEYESREALIKRIEDWAGCMPSMPYHAISTEDLKVLLHAVSQGRD